MFPRVTEISDAIKREDPTGLLWVPEEWETVVCGMADGADMAGLAWAEVMGKQVAKVPVTHELYDRFGKYLAPRMRNRRMAELADAAVLFWDGKSGGTADMSIRMTARKKPVLVIPWAPRPSKRRRSR